MPALLGHEPCAGPDAVDVMVAVLDHEAEGELFAGKVAAEQTFEILAIGSPSNG